MRRIILTVFFVASLCGVSFAQTPTTPHFHLYLPMHDQTNWDVLVNDNFTSIDSLLAGTISSAVPASYQNVVASPTAPSTTSNNTMQGLAGVITPTHSGNVHVTIQGTIYGTSSTITGNGIGYAIAYGTGSAPANGDAATGTVGGGTGQLLWLPIAPVAATFFTPFSIDAWITGLSIGTAYWFDLQSGSLGTASAVMLVAVNVIGIEQ